MVPRVQVGDRVWSAGVLNRNGTNADFVAIDERIVGHAPKNLSWADAAAIPLALVRCLAAPYLTTLPPPHPGAPRPQPLRPLPQPLRVVCLRVRPVGVLHPWLPPL